MASIRLLRDAQDDYDKLDGSTRRAVLKALAKLGDEPEQRGQPLGGELTGLRRIVVGNRDLRIVYRVRPDGEIVLVVVIGKRADDEVYRIALTRIQQYADQFRWAP